MVPGAFEHGAGGGRAVPDLPGRPGARRRRHPRRALRAVCGSCWRRPAVGRAGRAGADGCRPAGAVGRPARHGSPPAPQAARSDASATASGGLSPRERDERLFLGCAWSSRSGVLDLLDYLDVAHFADPSRWEAATNIRRHLAGESRQRRTRRGHRSIAELIGSGVAGEQRREAVLRGAVLEAPPAPDGGRAKGAAAKRRLVSESAATSAGTAGAAAVDPRDPAVSLTVPKSSPASFDVGVCSRAGRRRSRRRRRTRSS